MYSLRLFVPVLRIQALAKTVLGIKYTLLKLLAFPPVPVATVERSFSILKKFKTHLKNTSEIIINFFFVHRKIRVNDEKVVNMFANVAKKLDFVL